MDTECRSQRSGENQLYKEMLSRCEPPRAVFSHYRETVKRSSQSPLIPQGSVICYKAVFVSSRYVPPCRRSIVLRDITGQLCSRLLVSGDVYRPVGCRVATILDKILEQQTPLPPNQGSENGAFLPFAPLHP